MSTLRYLRPIPHFFKYFNEICATGSVSYAIVGETVSAWDPAFVPHSTQALTFLKASSFSVTNGSLISVAIASNASNTSSEAESTASIDIPSARDSNLRVTYCTARGVLFNSLDSNQRLDLHLPETESCIKLIALRHENQHRPTSATTTLDDDEQSSEATCSFLVATSCERLFLVAPNLSRARELILNSSLSASSANAGNSSASALSPTALLATPFRLLSGITSYAKQFIWSDVKETVSLSAFRGKERSRGIVHTSRTHANCWYVVGDEGSDGELSLALRLSLDLSSLLGSIRFANYESNSQDHYAPTHISEPPDSNSLNKNFRLLYAVLDANHNLLITLAEKLNANGNMDGNDELTHVRDYFLVLTPLQILASYSSAIPASITPTQKQMTALAERSVVVPLDAANASSSELHSVEPIKIYEDEIFVVFRETVLHCRLPSAFTDTESIQYQSLSRSNSSLGHEKVEAHVTALFGAADSSRNNSQPHVRVLGTVGLSRSILCYTSEGVYECLYQREELERRQFGDLFLKVLSGAKYV